MKVPENYTSFKDNDEKIKKYKEWGFIVGKKGQIPQLLYKGSFSEHIPEKCDIIGYTDILSDEMVVVIHLIESDKDLPIDRLFLKQMQLKSFRLDCSDDLADESSENNIPGKELKKLVNDYVVYDIETTGLNADNDEIIEIAAIKIKNGIKIDSFNFLVNPNCKISPKITKITGIDNITVSDAQSISEVLPAFLSFIDNDILIGHNIKQFDNKFISKAMIESNMGVLKNNYIDTLTISNLLLPEMGSHSLSNLIEHYSIEKDKSQHRALNDCEYTYLVYEKMKEDIKNNYGDISSLKGKPKNSENKKDNHSKSTKYPKYEDLRLFTSEKKEFDKNNPFYEKHCVFTGELEKYSREEAAQIIVDLGGKCENNVTKKTNYLIVSSNSDPNKKSGKQKKAEEYKLKGQDITVISENVFYDMISI